MCTAAVRLSCGSLRLTIVAIVDNADPGLQYRAGHDGNAILKSGFGRIHARPPCITRTHTASATISLMTTLHEGPRTRQCQPLQVTLTESRRPALQFTGITARVPLIRRVFRSLSGPSPVTLHGDGQVVHLKGKCRWMQRGISLESAICRCKSTKILKNIRVVLAALSGEMGDIYRLLSIRPILRRS